MIRLRDSLSFALLILHLSSICQGAEGFHEDGRDLPKSVKQWASRVFMVFHEQRKVPIGTAFLVHHDRSGMHFVTVKHVAVNCTGPLVCSLRFGRAWNAQFAGADFESPITHPVIEVRLFDPDELSAHRWRAAANADDLAYFRAESSGLKPRADLKNLGPSRLSSFSDDQQSIEVRHFILGYPYLAARPSLKSQPRAQIITLRWSEGSRLVRRQPYYAQVATFRSDADSIGGNSGGPVVAESGQLLGVLYGGPNTREYADMPSYVVPIDYVRRMIGLLLLRKQKGVPDICTKPWARTQENCPSSKSE